MEAMRAKLNEIIDEAKRASDNPKAREREATAMAALTHLAVFEVEAKKFAASDENWGRRRLAMEARFIDLIRELEIPVKAAIPTLGAFDLVPA